MGMKGHGDEICLKKYFLKNYFNLFYFNILNILLSIFFKELIDSSQECKEERIQICTVQLSQ